MHAVGLGAVRRGIAVILLAAVALVAAGCRPGGEGAETSHDDAAEVVRVVDGDTLIATVDGEEQTIRLLNVDTPETKHPDRPVECLGPEATAFLEERLPSGTSIDLAYDQERTDRYGRTLAGVYESAMLVNAEIAAAGLGVPMLVEPNDRFYEVVATASRDAERNGRGLFAEDVDCTVASQVLAAQDAVASMPAVPADPTLADPAAAVEESQAVLEQTEALALALQSGHLAALGSPVLGSSAMGEYLDALTEDARSAHEASAQRVEDLENAQDEYDEEQERLEQEREEQERQRQQEESQEPEPEPTRSAAPREEATTGSGDGSRSESSSTPPAPRPSSAAPSSTSPSPDADSSGGRESSESDGSGGGGGEGSSGSDGSSESSGSSGGGSSSSCVPYGPEVPYSDDGGYTGKRYGMPGGKTFRKCR